jgi:hypothetical protein
MKDFLDRLVEQTRFTRRFVQLQPNETPAQFGILTGFDHETGEPAWAYKTLNGYRCVPVGMREETDDEFRARLEIALNQKGTNQ